MVRPKSRKSVSRRSSILKAPVVQQPLQDVKANTSLYQETSITIKQKRRVSFADKKHVKEFCDSVEQGTLWDNTYEESSSEISGQINLNSQYYQTINNDHQDINDDKVINEHADVMNNSLALTESISTMGLYKPLCVENISIIKVTPILCESTNKNDDNHSTLVESNANIDIHAHKSIVVYNDTLDLNDKENAELDKTCAQDVSMEITEIPHIIRSRHIAPMMCEQFFEDKENIAVFNTNNVKKTNVPSTLQNKMNKVSDETQYSCTEQLEFTECLQSVIKPTELQAKLSKVTPVVNDEESKNDEETNQKTQIFQDVPMEITCSIPLIDRENCIDRTIIFNDASMDNTMIITSVTNEKETSISTNRSEEESNRTKLLNASMEITNNICSLYHAKSNDATTSSVYYNKNTQLNDNTMEFSLAATNLPAITESNKCTILDPNRLTSENTIFHNKSMEFTEALHIPKIIHNNDITKLNDAPLNSLMNNEDVMSSKTQIFQNESMAITASLHTPHISHNNDIQKLSGTSINSLVNNEDKTSKTQIFEDESMAITAPLHIPNISHNNDIQKLSGTSINSLVNNEDKTSKTQIFEDESMAITAPLHIPNISHNNDIQKLNDTSINSLLNNEDIMSSKTQIFQDESMAITVPLYTPNILHNNDIQPLQEESLNPLMNNEDLMSSKTQIFQDESMAITASLHTPNALHNNNIPKLHDVSINSLSNNEDITSLNTRVFQNMSMEITTAITNLPIYSNSRKLSEITEEDYVNLNISGKKDEASINNKATSGIANNTADSSTTNYTENCENNSTRQKPVNALTSLISSFVYADMIEDDSFVTGINENGLQCMINNIEQETKCQQNNIERKSTIDNINGEVGIIQFSNKCTAKNKEIIREHGSYIEYHQEDNNIDGENIIINREENNQCNPKLILSKSIKINEDVFEQSIEHERICDTSVEIKMSKRNKQLNETKKDIEKNLATFIIKPKKHSKKKTLLSASSKNILSKVSITENNLTANLTSNMNLSDFYEQENCNNDSLNEDIEHVTLHEKSKESSTFQKGTFSSLVHQLKMYMSSNDCIWDLYLEDIDKQMLVVSFISKSLLIVISAQNDVNTATCSIKHIDIISCLENDKNVQLSIAHKLIKEKINVKYINQLYKYNESVVPVLNHISEDVKLVLDFIFDLKRLDNTNLMEINIERITFIVRSKYMNIVLEVTMDIKLFDKIDSSNINILCILGTVRKEDIKELIINIKRDHRFLRRFMSDIKGYIDIIEQADLANKKSCS